MLLPLIDRVRATSLRTRLTIWNTVVVLLMTAATLVAVRVAARTALYADADAELLAATREVGLAVAELDPDEVAVTAEMRRKAESQEERGWFMQLLTEDGVSIWKSDHCPNEVATFPPSRIDREENVVQVGHYRYVRRRIARSGRPAYHVRIGVYTTGLDENLAGLMRLLVTVGGILSLLTPAVAYWLAMRATRPVADILETADRLSPTQLGDRLPARGTEDELGRLSRTINRLLDSVASHVERQEQFVADAAHELRGPLTALQSSLEAAIAKVDAGLEADSHQEDTLSDMLEATRHLSKIANDLLLLAETANQSTHDSHGPVDIATIARQAVGMFSGAAEDRGLGLSITSEGQVMAVGDPTYLRRLVSNLLDNAIRFTPPGGRVEVTVAEVPEPALRRVVLTVVDTGSGICKRDLEHVFERFYKADPSRSHGSAGRTGGLGLAICKSIADACGGTIGVSSEVGKGTAFTVRLRLARKDAPDPRAPQTTQAPQPTSPSSPILLANWRSRFDA